MSFTFHEKDMFQRNFKDRSFYEYALIYIPVKLFSELQFNCLNVINTKFNLFDNRVDYL